MGKSPRAHAKCAAKSVQSWTLATSKWNEMTVVPCSDGHHQVNHAELRPNAADVVIM